MRALVPILAAVMILTTAAAATTIVVGGCASGDYEFNDLYEALREADGRGDVNIIICGAQELERGTTVEARDITITGGTVTSDYERIRLHGDTVRIQDVNLINTRLYVVAEGDIVVKNVRSSVEGYTYCLELNAGGDVTLDDLHVAACNYGVHVLGADELNVWSVYTDGETEAVRFDPENVRDVTLNPIKTIEERVVEKVVEKNVPVREVVYWIPPEVSRELEGCQELVALLQKKKGELEEKVAQLYKELDEAESGRAYPDIWALAGIALAGIVVGYLLGRI